MGNKRNMIVERLKTLKKEMGHKQRFVIMDSETFRERWSFQLSARNLFVAVGLSVIVLVVLTTILIAFTSLREYIPGYMQTDLVEQVHKSTATIDSLEQKLYEQDLMLANIKALIMGEEISEKEHKRDSLKVKPGEDVRSKSDSLLRNEIESQDKYQVKSSTSYADNADNLDGNHVYVNISDKGLPTDYLFYTPLKGKVISVFEPHKRHYGIDIAGSENAVIKSVYNGTVLFSDFTLKTGYIIAIQHPNNMISVYKHNSALLKHTGDVVRAGEPIAFIGNTGELTSGPHLHLELWYNGKAINPVEYISF
ncbi:MAG: M23 family metallopeptidase [Bacteroidales bacterium]|nr:M23 family metallopeptidase [Bacteroidales bacterium]